MSIICGEFVEIHKDYFNRRLLNAVEEGPYFQASLPYEYKYEPEGGSCKFTASFEPTSYSSPIVKTFFSIFAGISAKGPKVEDSFETGKNLKNFNFIEETKGYYERIE